MKSDTVDTDQCFHKRADVYADVSLPVHSNSRVAPPTCCGWAAGPLKWLRTKGRVPRAEAGHPEEQGSLPGRRSLRSPEVLAQPPAAFPAHDDAPCRHLPSRARGRFSVIWVNTISKSNRNPNLPSFYKFSSTDGTISKDRGGKLGRIFFSPLFRKF